MDLEKLPIGKKIILFDGICNLCESSVQIILRNDKNDVFRFIALQSPSGQEIIQYLGIANRNIDSIVLYIPKKAYYYKSDAVLEIAKDLPRFFWMRIFKILPTSLRDKIYDYVAKNRYHWYGKKDACMIPTPEIKAKFLS